MINGNAIPMNLRKIRGYYHIWFSRSEVPPNGRMVSLKTKDDGKANKIFAQYLKDWHDGKIAELESRGKSVKLSVYLEKYIEGRGDLSDDTLRADRLAFNRFIDVVGDKLINTISKADFERFKSACRARKLSVVSINTYLRHLRAGFNAAVDLEYLNKPIKIKGLKAPHRLPQPIPKDDLSMIINAAACCDYEMWRIINCALYTGCRQSEILGIKYQDIRDGYLRIIGKGNRERRIPLHESLDDVLGNGDIGPVFVRWHKNTVSHRFLRIARALEFEYHFHQLRHSAATYMLSAGIPLEFVQKILGHASITTTQIYADVMDDVLKKEMEKFTLTWLK